MPTIDAKTPPSGPAAIPTPWGHTASGKTFNADYPTEFRPSQIPGAGQGWWALVDIPKGTQMRRVAISEGTLFRIGSQAELEATGWDIDDSVNYGIGHRADPEAIFFFKPGTCINHADSTRKANITYSHDEKDAYTMITSMDVKAGDEMFCEYQKDYGPCAWYDQMQVSRGNIPLCQLNVHIEKMNANAGE